MDAQIFLAMKEIISMLVDLGQPVLRLYVILGVATVTGAFVMSLIGSMLSEHRINFIVCLMLLLFSCFLVLLGATLAWMYLCPHIGADYRHWTLIGVAVLTFLLVAIPVMAKINGMNYLVALSTMLVAVVATVLMMYLVGLLYDVIVDGRESFRSGRSSKRARDRALGF